MTDRYRAARARLLALGVRDTVIDDLDAMIPADALGIADTIERGGPDFVAEVNQADVLRRIDALKENAGTMVEGIMRREGHLPR